MKTDKSEWVDSILSSIEGIEKAKAPDYLFDQIDIYTNPQVIAIPKVILSIAAAVVLIMLNLFVINSIINQNISVEETETLYLTQGESIISNYNLYQS